MLPVRRLLAAAVALLVTGAGLLHAETAPIPLADGFDLPVGRDHAKGYH